MKNKLFGIFICCILLLGIAGCGKDEDSSKNATKTGEASIVDNNGETKMITAQELLDVYNNNEAKFKKYYAGAEISLTGVISSIEESFEYINGTVYLYVINLEEGWRVEIRKDGNEDFIADLDKGTKIKVDSNIVDKWNSQIEVYGVKKCDDPSSCYNELNNPYYDIDKTVISIID